MTLSGSEEEEVGQWNPKTLFSGGQLGGWYDPSDMSSLFQDTAGVTPVTTDGQTVALMRDKSGNGEHALQSTSGDRPVFRQSGSLRWLEFDGTSDRMILPEFGITGGADRSFFGAVRRTGAADTFFSVGLPSTTGQRWTFRLPTGGSALRVEIQGSGYTSALTLALNTDSFVGAMQTTNILSGCLLYLNDAVETATGSNSLNTVENTTNSGIFGATIGSSFNGTAGRFYGGIYLGREVASNELERLKTYYKRKAGI